MINKKRMLRISGILSIFIGIVMLFNGFSSMTGFVVLEEVGRTASSIFGLVFVIGGILLFGSNNLEEKVNDEKYETEFLAKEYKKTRSNVSRKEEDWVTLYHAYPRDKKFRYDQDSFIDKKKIKNGAFYMASTPEAAIMEISDYDPSDVSVMKVSISREFYNEVIEAGATSRNGEVYRIPKNKIRSANALYRIGYIKLGRGR